MTEKILTIEKSNMIINLYREKLEVDLKEGMLQKVETLIEEYPIISDSLGFLMQSFFPLDVLLRDIEDVERINGKIRIIIPLRRDIEISLNDNDLDLLYNKLKELIPQEKNRYYEQIVTQIRARKEAEKDKFGKIS